MNILINNTAIPKYIISIPTLLNQQLALTPPKIIKAGPKAIKQRDVFAFIQFIFMSNPLTNQLSSPAKCAGWDRQKTPTPYFERYVSKSSV